MNNSNHSNSDILSLPQIKDIYSPKGNQLRILDHHNKRKDSFDMPKSRSQKEFKTDQSRHELNPELSSPSQQKAFKSHDRYEEFSVDIGLIPAKQEKMKSLQNLYTL